MDRRDGRRARMAKVHIAKNFLAMHDDSYRSLLRRITGKDSSAACDEAELDAVITEFKRLGWNDKKTFYPASDKAYVRKIYAIWTDLRPYVASHGRAALRRFVQRQTRSAAKPEGVTAAEFLTPEEGNLVLEGLKAWLKRERDKAAERLTGAE